MVPHDHGSPGKGEHRLGDVVAGVGTDPACELLPHVGRGVGADEDAVAAGLVGRLHHELVEPAEHHGPFLLVPAEVRGHVGQDDVLAQVVPDDLRDEGVDDLVVGDAGAGGIGDAQVPRPVDVEQPRGPQQRLGSERQRVEEVVGDPAVEHVHPLEPSRGAHAEEAVVHEQIPALDQLDAHLLRQERVLEVGRVVHPRREDRDGRRRHPRRRDPVQHLEQAARVVLDRAHAGGLEDVVERALEDLAVLEHVGDARRAPQVVLEDVELAVGIPHEVGPGDVAPHPPGRVEALALGEVPGGAEDDLLGHDTVGHDLLVVVDVVAEGVEGGHPLFQAALNDHPVFRFDDPRHEVEGEDALGGTLGPVDVERDPEVQQRRLGGLLPAQQLALGEVLDPLDEELRSPPGTTPRLENLVVEALGLVFTELAERCGPLGSRPHPLHLPELIRLGPGFPQRIERGRFCPCCLDVTFS